MSPLPEAEQLDKINPPASANGKAVEESTWLPVNLELALNGENPEPRPTLLIRSDGEPLIYKGKITSIAAEPEAGKTKLLLHAAAETIAAGGRVVWLDFETTPTETVAGLMDLGADPDCIRVHFTYIGPDAPLDELAWSKIEPLIKTATLVAVDGVTEVFTLHGLNPSDPVDTAKYQSMLTKRIRAYGAAVVEIDHVVKSKEGRGRWSTGSGHKLAGVDVGLTLTVVDPFARGVSGSSRLSISKDRPGHLRPLAVNGHRDLALVHYDSEDDGALSVRLEPVGPGDDDFRPTYLMEQVSRAIEDLPGITANAIRKDVKGKNDYKAKALTDLIKDGFVRREIKGQGHFHYSETPYREGAEE